MKIALQTFASALIGAAFFGTALFVPAGTVDYWHAWVFIAVFTVCTLVPSTYLALRRPEVLQRRLKVGPMAETRSTQRFVIAAMLLLVAAVLVVSALDWRYSWSTVPQWAVALGNALVAAGLLGAQLVVVQNDYAGSSITVEKNQPLVSTGLYGVVRHPMYSSSLVMMAGSPPALGSFWGLAAVTLLLPVLAARILDEEKMLRQELPGYPGYASRVRKRLVPGVW